MKSSTITITRLLEFDAAHRVMGHESKCATLHGHRYRVEVEAQAPELDTLGRVIDFSVLKEKLGGWLDKFWDHTSIIAMADREVWTALEQLPQNKPVFILPYNPTAENMAHYLLHEICPFLLSGTDVLVKRITIWETPNCRATAELPHAH